VKPDLCTVTTVRRAPDISTVSTVGAVSDGLRALGLYTHAEAVRSACLSPMLEPRIRALQDAGRALLDIDAAFVAAGCDEWATAAARVAMLIRDLLRERGSRSTVPARSSIRGATANGRIAYCSGASSMSPNRC
jgi:hypothetical protein